MAYEALARKYRPRTFDEVVGQDPIVRTLTNAIREKRVHHAYVFSGVRGVGKTTVARIFAKALNCEKGPTPEPCLECDPCVEIAAGRDLDVIEMDAASRTGVDDVRDLIDTTRYSPARDRYKVFIIDEFHMLSKPAFNALLKTLEEPPPRVVFVMATTELHKVLPTVLSRTQQFDFRKVPLLQIADQLGAIAKKEGVKVPRACLEMLARAGDGSVRDAESLLDQAIAFCGSSITEADVRTLLGLAPEETVEAFLAAAGARDAGALIQIVANMLDQGHDLRLFHAGLIEGTRRLLVLKAAADPSGILGLAEGDEKRLAGIAGGFTTESLLRIFSVLAALEGPLRYSDQPRYLLEAAAIRIAAIADLSPIEDLIARLEGGPPAPGGAAPGRGAAGPGAHGAGSPGTAPSGAGSGRSAPASPSPKRPRGLLDGGPSAGPAPTSGAPPRSAGDDPAPDEIFSAAGQAGGEDPSDPGPGQGDPREHVAMPPAACDEQGMISAFLAELHARKNSLATLVELARSLCLAGNVLEIQFDDAQAFARKSIEQPANLELVREAAQAAFGAEVRIEIRKAEGRGSTVPPRRGSRTADAPSPGPAGAPAVVTAPRAGDAPARADAGSRRGGHPGGTAGAPGEQPEAVPATPGQPASAPGPFAGAPAPGPPSQAAAGAARVEGASAVGEPISMDVEEEAGPGAPAGGRSSPGDPRRAVQAPPETGAVPPGTPKFQRMQAQALEEPVVKSLIQRFGARIVEIKEVP